MTKMTKKDYFAQIRTIVKNANPENVDAFLAFIDHEFELLAKRSSSATMTKTKKENVGIMAAIGDALAEVGKPVTISDLQAAVPAMAAFSNQKLSALLKKMSEGEGATVVKTVEKKKSYFSLAAVPAEDEDEG